MSNPKRIYCILTERGTFRFHGDNKAEAQDHKSCLDLQDWFPKILDGPRYVGSSGEYAAGWVWEGMSEPQPQPQGATRC